MIDTLLCFGGKRLPEFFNDQSQAMRVILATKGYPNIVVYRDDYLCVADSFEECLQTISTLIAIQREFFISIITKLLVKSSQVK